eukprot:TRINITY_DN3911_c0_g1_i1.p1 TRINITY_DN3911_c0_g1~~TRINITY_DN3911_c0_g1_i1.p1  ORF type:complete len:732 (-),score=174.58 TRINITY_DN3911_c0_g1_i1:51-2246(-)
MGAASSSRLLYEERYKSLFQTPKEGASVDGLAKASLESDDFWSPFWNCNPPPSLDELNQIITAQDISKLRTEKPEVLSLLLRKIVGHLATIVHKHDQTVKEGNVRPVDIPFETSCHILNCVRFLTRVLPLVFEDRKGNFLDDTFWNLTSKSPDMRASAENKPAAPEEPLAVKLLNVAVLLLFLPGFTISASEQVQRAFLVPLSNIWAPGVGVSEVLPTTPQMMVNRTDILRLLIACFSESLFVSPDQINRFSNRWVQHVACNPSIYSLAMFFSLTNASFNYDPIGWGIPYNHLMFADYQEGLADLSLQVLAILLNYNPNPVYNRPPTNATGAPEIPKDVGPQPYSNTYTSYIRDLKKKDDFKFIFDHVTRLLNNTITATKTMLPGSTKQVTWNQELLIFFWKLIQENKAFMSYICLQDDVLKVVVPFLHFINDGRKDLTQLGTLHISTFILLVLSGERDFGVALNKPCLSKPRNLPAFSGNHADFLILVFFNLFVDGHEHLEPLYECLLTIITNISPYIKSLSMVASMKLLKLFELLSRPSLIFSAERNYRYAFFMLEILINIIEYQYEGNTKLVYAVLRNQEAFVKLAKLSLANYKPKPEAAEVQPTTATNQVPVILTAHAPFVPTEDWLAGWKAQLPISTILHLIESLAPQINNLITGSATDEAQILQYLANITLVGLLPVPHPILIRKYQQNEATDIWFTTFIWGVIFRRSAVFHGSYNLQAFSIRKL